MSQPAPADGAPRKAIFGRKSNPAPPPPATDTSSGPSSAVVAGSLRQVEDIASPSDNTQTTQNEYPSSAAVAGSLPQPAQQATPNPSLSPEQQERARQHREQAELLARLKQQQQPSSSTPSVYPGAHVGSGSSSISSPIRPTALPATTTTIESDQSVDPSAHSQEHGLTPDELGWLQKSSMQQSPVTVYYSKDPISNLQLRVLLRRQPDDASASSQPKTFKQLNLAIKEKQNREERERAAMTRSGRSQASATSEGGDDLADHTTEQRDELGRLSLSPNTDADFKPAVIAIQLFSWQQKVVSPAEILLAASGSKAASSYADQVRNMLKDRYPAHEQDDAAKKLIATQRDGMMLSSKRDHDRYIDPDDMHKVVTTSKDRELNPLAERIVLAPLVSRRNDSHLTREGGSTPFHILATVDLPSDASEVYLLHADSPEHSIRPPQVKGSFQKPIASIKAFEGDEYVTLEIRPPFSPPQKDPTRFDDAEWYSFYTPGGDHFRYRLENFSGVIEEEELSLAAAGSGMSRALIALEQRQVEAELARMAHHDMLVTKHRSGRDFDQGPLTGFETFHIFGDIIQTLGFEEDTLSIAYEIDLRSQIDGESDVWTARPSDRLEAVTQTSYGRFEKNILAGQPDVRACYFSFPFEVKLSKPSTAAALPPIMYFTVQSQSRWGITSIVGYGFVHLPLTPGCHEVDVDTWVPLGTLSDQKTNFFIGAGPTLRDVKLCGVPKDKVTQQQQQQRWMKVGDQVMHHSVLIWCAIRCCCFVVFRVF